MNKKIVLVSGANSKLGTPLVDNLAKKNIVYAGMRSVDKNMWTGNANIFPIKLDVTSDSQAQLAIKKIIKKHGRIDCVINNAGSTLVGPTLGFTSTQFKEILDVNTVGAFRLCKYAIEKMEKQKSGGKIINITSLNGLISLPNFGLYSSSKFALGALSSALRIELFSKKIYVTTIAPGAIKLSTKTNIEHGMPHKPIREKYKILNLLFGMATQKDVISKIIKVMESKSPPARVIVGRDAHITYYLSRLLPDIIWDKLLTFVWKK